MGPDSPGSLHAGRPWFRDFGLPDLGGWEHGISDLGSDSRFRALGLKSLGLGIWGQGH